MSSFSLTIWKEFQHAKKKNTRIFVSSIAELQARGKWTTLVKTFLWKSLKISLNLSYISQFSETVTFLCIKKCHTYQKIFYFPNISLKINDFLKNSNLFWIEFDFPCQLLSKSTKFTDFLWRLVKFFCKLGWTWQKFCCYIGAYYQIITVSFEIL